MRHDPTAVVVLLRGVNVSGRSLPMSVLRAACADVGCTAAQTYLQSGNAIVQGPLGAAELATALERAVATRAGFEIPVVTRTAAELAAVVERCPFATTGDPTRLVVSFAQALPAEPLGELDLAAFGDEHLAHVGRDLYLELPRGQGHSPLARAVSRTPFGRVATARNWRTVLALRDLASHPPFQGSP